MRRSTLIALAFLVTGSAQAPPADLAPGATLERAFAAEESQRFDTSLAAGKVYRLTVELRGIHLVTDVRGPDGLKIAAIDSPLDRWGSETVLLRPAASGRFQIEVRAETKGVGPGRCALRLEEIPESSAGLVEMTEAGTILRREPAGSLEKVLAAFQKARGHFQAAGDRPDEAEAINDIA